MSAFDPAVTPRLWLVQITLPQPQPSEGWRAIKEVVMVVLAISKDDVIEKIRPGVYGHLLEFASIEDVGDPDEYHSVCVQIPWGKAEKE